MKKTVKKFGMVLSLAACMGMMMTGCGGNDAAQTGGETTETYTIGINQFADHGSLDNCREGFIEGLRQAGFEEGVNVEFEYSNANADPGIANQIAQSHVSTDVDLICAIATPSAQASYNAAMEKEIPVIYTAVSDPVEAGLAEEGMNVTGTSDLLPLKEQVAMIRELMPEAKNLGVLYCTSEVNSLSNIARLEQIAPEYGFTLVTKGVSAPADIPMATDAILNEVDCLTNLTDNTIVNSLAVVMDKANAKGIPVFGSEVEQVKLGCAAAANIDYYKLGIMTGKMAADVLNGTDITTIPYEIIEDNQLVVNSEVLEKYGLVVPEGMEVTEAADITNEA
ncbi:MAG: ABC transporter substrate-binding protein [Peptococcaceae bacterium]|nr:ABC transporter substrate-binding protein [Peptococcaceae bacterium]MBQ3509662.1 ABC transporter substrate-binding protein [Peptococcaceae bacterium]